MRSMHERMYEETDYRRILPAIHVPVAILQPDDEQMPAAEWMAAQMPGGDRRSAPGVAGLSAPNYSHPDRNLRETARTFMSGLQDEEAEFDRVLATVLFTDIVGFDRFSCCELGDRALARPRRSVTMPSSEGRSRGFRGIEIDTAGDGFFATFDGPGARRAMCDVSISMPSVRSASRSGQAYTQESARPSTGRSAGIGVVIGARSGPKRHQARCS